MNLLDKMNRIRWQVLRRLPNGGLYEALYRRINSKELNENKIDYYLQFHDLHESPIKLYFLDYHNSKIDSLDKFYQWLDNNYLVNGDYYSFNIDNRKVKIIKPDISQKAVYKYELFDMIIPYLIQKNYNFEHLPFNEGPYEFVSHNKQEGVYLNQNDTVLDLGANYGMFSAYASSKNCKVYAFEPSPIIVDSFLSKTALLNDNIEIVKAAVSNQVGEASFSVDYRDYGSSHLSSTMESISHQNRTFNVKVDTVDHFIETNNLSKVDFIKADIEGSEREMLIGAKRCLQEFAPKLSICGYHKINDLQVLKSLILEANPHYQIEQHWKKIYAYVPKK